MIIYDCMVKPKKKGTTMETIGKALRGSGSSGLGGFGLWVWDRAEESRVWGLGDFGLGAWALSTRSTHRLLSSSFLGLPYRILYTNHKKELLWSLWVSRKGYGTSLDFRI